MQKNTESGLYNYFKEYDNSRCFFTGVPVAEDEQITVFPEWLMKRYQLENQYLGMLNWNKEKYGQLKVPCSLEAQKTIHILEEKMAKAFEAGYDEVVRLDKNLIFVWAARILCGLLFYEIKYGKELGSKKGREFPVSPLLTRKYSDLMMMVQSLFYPITWEGSPYSIAIKKVDYSKDGFNFRDETRRLNFSLGMLNFGIVLCLQDRGEVSRFNQDVLEKIGDAVLHPIQFEELCARFIYTNYIMKEHAGWSVIDTGGGIIMQPVREQEEELGPWDDKIYSSTLGEYWKPWGIESKDIYNFPDSPVSFLVDEYTNQFIEKEKIKLPN